MNLLHFDNLFVESGDGSFAMYLGPRSGTGPESSQSCALIVQIVPVTVIQQNRFPKSGQGVYRSCK